MKLHNIKLSSIISGLLVIIAGGLLFAFNAGTLPIEYKPIIFSWQMLLISIGFVCLFSYHKWIFGIFLMLAGGFFILPKLDIESLSFLRGNSWALLLIVAGIFIICKTIFGRRYKYKKFMHHQRFSRRGIEAQTRFTSSQEWENRPNESGYIYRDYVFGGSKEKIDIPNFKGGEINCVFGGIQLDLTDAQLAEGVSTLKISAVFGGIVLFTPVDWRIEIRQEQVFGHFEDKRPEANFEIDENRVLIVHASSVFGGGEIKCKPKNQ